MVVYITQSPTILLTCFTFESKRSTNSEKAAKNSSYRKEQESRTRLEVDIQNAVEQLRASRDKNGGMLDPDLLIRSYESTCRSLAHEVTA